MRFDFDSFHIEPIKIQDAWNICNFVTANEDRLKQYFPKTLEQTLTPNLSRIFAEKKIKQFQLNQEFLFTIKENKTTNLIGLIYLKSLDWNKKQGEFAYCIHYELQGKGITTQAIEALSEHAFNTIGLETLQIIVYKTNYGSVKVAKNCNFTWIKTLEKEYTPLGKEPIDMELYELYKEIE